MSQTWNEQTLNEIPTNYEELVAALKGVPSFAASFALIMLFIYCTLGVTAPWIATRYQKRVERLEG